MAPPTIAPPISPAATPAATPRCALAGVAASEPAIVATATKAVIVFFMSRALLEMAPAASAGFKLTHTPYSKLDVSLKSAPQSIESKRFSGCRLEKRFFQANGQNRVISRPVCKEDERGLSRKPASGEPASHSRPRSAVAARRSSHPRHRPDRRNNRSRVHNNRVQTHNSQGRQARRQ